MPPKPSKSKNNNQKPRSEGIVGKKYDKIFLDSDLRESLINFGKEVQQKLFGQAFSGAQLDQKLIIPDNEKPDIILSWESRRPNKLEAFAIRFRNILPKTSLTSEEIGKAVLVVEQANGLFCGTSVSENQRSKMIFSLFLDIVKMFIQKFPQNLLRHCETGSPCCGILEGNLILTAKDLTTEVCYFVFASKNMHDDI